MASFTGTVYLTTNNINGKIYIGLTIGNDKYYVGSGTVFKKALKKYGRRNFIKTVLRTNIQTIEELNYWEGFYVNMYNSTDRAIGYNMRPGGLAGGWKHTKESLLKISERSRKEDNITRFVEIQRMAARARIGTHHSKDSKIKAMITKFGQNRQINIYTKQGEFVSSCNFSPEASKITGVGRSNISNNLAGLSKFAGDYIFKYSV